VAVTGFARATDHDRSLAEGFRSHVPKPVEPAALVAALAPLVRERPGA
jgi:CheY-like chemotaxis protein